ALTDERSVDVEPGGGEVLSEDAIGEWPSELGLPVVEFLPGEGVDRLVGPTVVARIADRVSRNAAHSGSRTWIVELDRRWRRALVDPGDTRVGVPARRRTADVDGQKGCHQEARIAATSRRQSRRTPCLEHNDML